MRKTLATSLFALSLALGMQAAAAQDAIELHGASQFDDNHAFTKSLAKFGELVTECYGKPINFVLHKNRELGLEKTRDQLGRPRYVAPQDGRRTDPRESLAAVLSTFGLRAVPAQNLVVVQSELGSAPAIARALDRIEHPLIVGTLAGDDTCHVIAADRNGASALACELEDVIG